MVQIKWLSNGLYSLKNSHITAEFRLNSTSVTRGLPLVNLAGTDHHGQVFHGGRADAASPLVGVRRI